MSQSGRQYRRQVYQHVLATIYHNTGDPQRPMIVAQSLWTHLNHGNTDMRDAQKALHAAREHDAVVRWRDGDGKVRYGLDDAGIDELDHYGSPIFDADDVDALEHIIGVETSGQDPNRETIGWCNRRLAAIEDGDDNE